LDGSSGCNVTDRSDAPRDMSSNEEAQKTDDDRNGAAYNIYVKGTADTEAKSSPNVYICNGNVLNSANASTGRPPV